MKTLFNKQSFFLIAALIFIFGTSCQEKFVEPLDPFDKQRLEKDPAVINFGSGTSALRIKTNKTNIVEFPEGIRIKGSVFTEHERYGDIRLTNGDFVLLKDAAVRKLGKYYYHSDYGNLEISKNRFTRVAGDTLAGYSGMAAYGLFETPAHGILNKVKLPITPHGGMMMFGSGASFKTGADAAHFAVLNDDRYYFVLVMTQGLTFNIGEADAKVGEALSDANAGVSVGQGATYKFAIDPLDPFIYFRGDLTNIPSPVSTAGIGISTQGFLTYEPRVTIYDKVKRFDNGYLYLLSDIPIPFKPGDPTITAAEAVIRFEPGDFGAPIGFFDLLPVQFTIGANGTFTVGTEILPGFISVSVNLGDASVYMKWNSVTDFQMSFIGVLDPGDFPDPKKFMVDRIKDYGDKLGLGGKLEFLDYVALAIGPPSIPVGETGFDVYAKFLGTASSDPAIWELGMSNKASLALPIIGEIAAGESMFQWSPTFIKYWGYVDVGGFAGVEMLGELQWTSADFRLMGHAYLDLEANWSVVGFKIAMELLADIYKQSDLFGFHGIIYIEGKFWADVGLFKITVGAKFRVEILVESDGSFKMCVEMGIGPVGFEVCIDYTRMKNGNMLETTRMREIPIDQVPLENRFEPDDGPVKLPPDYVHDYKTIHVSKKVIKMAK